MSSKIPFGHVSIGDLASHVSSQVNLMGVVTDFQSPVKSKGSDWMCNFRLADSTVYDDGVKFRFFKPMDVELPKIQSNGDVVVLERIKITSWCGMTMGLSTIGTNWTVFPAASIPEKETSGPLKYLPIKGSAPTRDQMRYAVELCNSRPREPAEKGTSPASTPSLARRDKFALIKDVKVDTFYDLVGQVVKVYPGNGVVELYLTDYTSNQLLYNYEWGRDDPDADSEDGRSTSRKWPGPLGKHTLTVSLFPPHSYFAQNHVTENRFVFLRNTRIKFSKDGKMEGSLHTDQRNSDRVDVTIIEDHTDERVKAVLRRKLQYGRKFQHEHESFLSQYGKDSEKQNNAWDELSRGQKRKEPPQLTKTQQRKRRKQQKEEEKRKSRNDEGDKENTDPSTSASRAQTRTEIAKPTHLNKNVRTNKPNVPPRPLPSILSLSTHALTTPDGTPYTLPFQNINSRAVVRVVDFSPPNIADFAFRKKQASEFDVLSDCSEASSSSGASATDDGEPSNSQPEADDEHPLSKWQWRFALVLEDASPTERNQRLTAYVTDADAVFLLKLDACNFRRRPQALAALRERLFLLWGDLEERKKAADSIVEEGGRGRGMPFECCIKEYGVRKPRKQDYNEEEGGGKPHGNESGISAEDGDGETWGWERRFAMFGTTIL
ncbi:MAG: hypothetical protein L6R39_001569 [Caloplaca ligustica]|nr:MAG: hypothetical protein L6R39_001569 [Caloplaca ligustica]